MRKIARRRRIRLPHSIWMPKSHGVPSCYHGTPVEMVVQMAEEMKPGLGVDDTIDLIARFLADERGIEVKTPLTAPEDVRAEEFVRGLLATGVAEEIPEA
jgi:hypothetical protein